MSILLLVRPEAVFSFSTRKSGLFQLSTSDSTSVATATSCSSKIFADVRDENRLVSSPYENCATSVLTTISSGSGRQQDHPKYKNKFLECIVEFVPKLVLEVFGAGGAIWGFAEILGLRTL